MHVYERFPIFVDIQSMPEIQLFFRLANYSLISFAAVFSLWKNRHIRPLKYDHHELYWDVVVEETYEDDRILVGDLPEGITHYNLKLHLTSTNCISADIELRPVFCSDKKEAVVFFDDTIAGSIPLLES